MHKALNKCTVHHFADDTNLLFSNKSPDVIRKTMNNELELLFDWLCANRLSLNVAKTEFIIFRPPKMNLDKRVVLTLNHKKIFESRKIKYLGLLMDDRLTWKFHINELSKKLNRSVDMLFKIRHYVLAQFSDLFILAPLTLIWRMDSQYGGTLTRSTLRN